VVLSRISGVSALLFVAGTLLYFGAISPPLGPPEPSASKLVSWTMSHQQQLLFQFVPGYLAVLFAVLIALLVQLNGGRGVLAMLAYVGTGANLAIALVSFGLFFGTWTYIQRGGTSDGVLALATIAPTFTHASLIAQGLAIGCVGVMAVRARAWPAWLGWLTILTGAEQFLTDIAFASGPSFSTTATNAITVGGIARRLDIAFALIWPLALAVLLLVRPVSHRAEHAATMAPTSAATP
jgi:hypothetical protein